MCGEEGRPLPPQQQLWEAHLVGGVDELDTFVGDGQDDGGDLLHVLRGFLQETGGLSTHLLGARPGLPQPHAAWQGPRGYRWCRHLPPCVLAAPTVTYPHLGTGVLRGFCSSQIFDQHGTQILWERAVARLRSPVLPHGATSQSGTTVRGLPLPVTPFPHPGRGVPLPPGAGSG